MTRIIAFYLPQFHPIPENDAWWGPGFTEWTNVTKSTPLFQGHLQPRYPQQLGFYDLRVPETRNKQFELAKSHGIDGFCYYYYWFNGRRLLSKPIDDVLSGKVNSFPFCICWANENWTRRWDGQDKEILIEQNHSLENDKNFINDILPILAHPDYIKIEGKPLLIIYRVQRLIDPIATAKMWKDAALRFGLDGLHLAAVQSFGFNDPRPICFDSAIEFPPHFLYHYQKPFVNVSNKIQDISNNFCGNIYDYKQYIDFAISRPKEPYLLHRGCMCAWDNTPRRKNSATVYLGANPFSYENLLKKIIYDAEIERNNNGLVFINAWNEWAEGSTLEPCSLYGNSFLLATSRAKKAAEIEATFQKDLCISKKAIYSELTEKEPLLLIGHDAANNGAQINLLYFAKTLKAHGVPIMLLLLGGGPLVAEYENICPVIVKEKNFAAGQDVNFLLSQLKNRGFRRAITNTTVTGGLVPALKKAGFMVVSLVHELPKLIIECGLKDHLGAITAYSDVVVFASQFICDRIRSLCQVDSKKIAILPQGCYKRIKNKTRDKLTLQSNSPFNSFDLPQNTPIVLGLGYGDRRKGVDFFISIARSYFSKNKNVHFVWIGDLDYQMQNQINADMDSDFWDANVHFIPFSSNIDEFILASKVLLLTSREDPFPTVVLEALDAGIPVIGFEGAGGFSDLAHTGFVRLARLFDLEHTSIILSQTLEDEEFLNHVHKDAPIFIDKYFDYEKYVLRINEIAAFSNDQSDTQHSLRISELKRVTPSISVVVPAFNSSKFLKERLVSIKNQTLCLNEIILLDDCSSDESLSILKQFEIDSNIPTILIKNDKNSGSPFLQWQKGIHAASSDLIWIAEADDYCELDLVENLAPSFVENSVVLAYSHSRPVGEHGQFLSFSYDEYLNEVDPLLWTRSFKMQGKHFAEHYLFYRNTIPNASAVIFRRLASIQIIDHIAKVYKSCGDWPFYYKILQFGSIAFIPTVLNYHRRHDSSVISKTEKNDTYIDELFLIAEDFLAGHLDSTIDKYKRALLDRVISEYHRHKPHNYIQDISKHETYGQLYNNLYAIAFP